MKTAPVGELTNSVKTWNPSRAPDNEFDYIDLSSVDNASKTVIAATPTVGSEAPSRARQIVAAGDVLVSNVRPNLNAVAVVPPELDGATASTGFTVLRPTNELDGRFLFHWVRSPAFIGDMVRKATGASYPAVSDRIVKDSQIPAPPLPEQRRIAAILDHADALRAKRRQVLTHLDSLTGSVFRDQFAQVAETGRLGDLATTTSGGTPNRSVSANYGGGIPWVKSGELHAGVVTKTEETVSEQGLASSSAKLFPAGTVLLAMYGATAGVVGRLGMDAATNQAICAITPGPSLKAEYLIAALRAQTAQLVAKAAGGAQPNLSQGIIRDIVIPLPSLDDQTRFSGQVAAIDVQRSNAVRGQQMGGDLFASLQSRAFRGEL